LISSFSFEGVFDSTLERSDRKISAPANLETPKHRTPLFGPGSSDFRNGLKTSTPIPEGVAVTSTVSESAKSNNGHHVNSESPASSQTSNLFSYVLMLVVDF
jgi:hypothetical protein